MKKQDHSKESLRTKINIQSAGSITDYQYNHNGTQLAVSDSDGYVTVYQKNGQTYSKFSQFKADEAAIWKISWADPSFGDLIGIGSFKKKVSIFQFRGNIWTQIATHEQHEGSVNHVQFASPAYGLKLYAAGNDGKVSILEIKKNAWQFTSFHAHESSIHSLSIRPLALNQQQTQRIGKYPIIATAGKDRKVKIWKHATQFEEHKPQSQSRHYGLVKQFQPHKEAIRVIIWKKIWSQKCQSYYSIFSASEDGNVLLNQIGNGQIQTVIICQHQHPIFKISQSLTGNMLSVSVGNQQESSYLYGQFNEKWSLLQELK